jgi:hypothetical protein
MRRGLSVLAVAVFFVAFQPGTSLRTRIAELPSQPPVAIGQCAWHPKRRRREGDAVRATKGCADAKEGGTYAATEV